MAVPTFVTLDVRPLLADRQPPLPAVMAAVADLAPGQGLRVTAPFRPDPMIEKLRAQGFAATASELPDGGWQVEFVPDCRPAEDPSLSLGSALEAADWPDPRVWLDLTAEAGDPLVRIAGAAAQAGPGAVIFVLLADEPAPAALSALGHPWAGGHAADGSGYRMLVRVGD